MHENEESVLARNQLTRLALRSTHLQLPWGVIVGGWADFDSRSDLAFVVNRFKCGGETLLRVGHVILAPIAQNMLRILLGVNPFVRLP